MFGRFSKLVQTNWVPMTFSTSGIIFLLLIRGDSLARSHNQIKPLDSNILPRRDGVEGRRDTSHLRSLIVAVVVAADIINLYARY